MWFHICEKMAYVSTKLLSEKITKTITIKNMKAFTILADSGDKSSSLCRFLRPHFQDSFLKFFFFFSSLNSKMSKGMCKPCLNKGRIVSVLYSVIVHFVVFFCVGDFVVVKYFILIGGVTQRI